METREVILQKTFGLLLEKGAGNVSVTDIHQLTGMARGLLYHYFGSQEKLFQAATEKYLLQWLYWEKEEIKHFSVNEWIVFVVEKYNCMAQEAMEYFGENVTLGGIHLLFSEFLRAHPAWEKLYDEIMQKQYIFWKTALLNSFSRGELRVGLNLESLAHQFVFLQQGILLYRFCPPAPTETVYQLEKGLREFFEMIRR